jgi:hypothetical protein
MAMGWHAVVGVSFPFSGPWRGGGRTAGTDGLVGGIRSKTLENRS